MQKLIETILGEFWDKGLPSVIERSVSFHNIPGKINVAIGMRRSGKTFFLFQHIRKLLDQGLSRNRVLHLNFEDERLPPLNAQNMGQLVDAFYSLFPENHDLTCHLFFDEIQNVEGWPVVIRRLLNTKKVEIYLSGSSAKLLSSEINTTLRGRSLPTEIFPYSFTEHLKALGEQPVPKGPRSPKQRDLSFRKLKNYLRRGGFPETTHLSDYDHRRVLQEILNITVYRDMIERHQVGNVVALRQLIRMIIQNSGRLLSVHKCYKDLKSLGLRVGKDTLHEYLSYIEDCYLAFAIPLYTRSIRKQNSNPKKIYIVDTGLACANAFDVQDDWGHLFETLVYIDLRRRHAELFYYRTLDGYEVDFVVLDPDGKKCLYQVCWDMADKETANREHRALRAAEKELKIRGQIITSENYFDFIHDRG